MRKRHIVGLVFTTVFAVVVVSAASAFAATEWQLNAKPITSATATTTTGKFLLEDMNSITKVDIECNVTFDGSVGPGAADEITKILNSAGVEEKAENLAKVIEPSINCEIVSKGSCEEANKSKIILFPFHLPWKSELLLPSGETRVDDLRAGTGGEPGYEYTCKAVLLGNVTDVCTGTPGSVMTNETGGVNSVFEEAEPFNPPGNCSIGGEKETLFVGSGLVSSPAGTLTVS
ncbi:MAG TPA: hypothetical protein VIJ39_10270 [Solirubrobacteraceae bacterium]